MKYKAKYSQLVMPDDANNVGTLFGGQMISWMDLAAAKVAYRFLKGTGASGALTRAIDQVEFKVLQSIAQCKKICTNNQ